MRPSKTKAARTLFLYSLLSIACLLITACFAPLDYKGAGNTTISINLGGSAARSAFADSLSYTLVFTGPEGRTITEQVTGGRTVSVQVVPGLWVIDVEAFHENEVISRGTASEEVLAGQNHTVIIQMRFSANEAVKLFLDEAEGGDSVDNPVNLFVGMELSHTYWLGILEAIEDADKYVNLNLSECIGSSEGGADGGMSIYGGFNPLRFVSTGKEKIVSLVLPDTALATGQFHNFMSYMISSPLKSVSGAGVTHLEELAFGHNASLSSVNFPLLTYIGNQAFGSCTSLVDINFPQAAIISNFAFLNCTNLVNITLPQATSIGNYAFENCSSLTKIVFPTATTVNGYSFTGCTSLTSFELTGSGPLSVIENGRALVRNGTELVTYPTAAGNIQLDDIISIGVSAFGGNTSITNVNFQQVSSIGNSAFLNCTSLVSVDFPLVETIGEWTFYNCANLTSINFPLVTTIGNNAFSNCTNLTSVTLPLVNTIDGNAFWDCISLTSITIGENVELEHASFPSDFYTFYNDNGRKAGIYILDSSDWHYMQPAITLNFDAGQGTFSQDRFTISRTGANNLETEKTITITGDGYTNPRWMVNGILRGTGDSITINALDYPVDNNFLSLWVDYGGLDWSRELEFTVTY